MELLNKLFKLNENNTTVRQEVVAGLTTFMTMSYIIFVQPMVLATDFAGNPTGLSLDAVMLATCVSAALATLIMGLYANYPIALAPGMGENFFFVSVIMTVATGVGWVVFVAMVAAYLMVDAERVGPTLLRVVPPRFRDEATKLGELINRTWNKFLRGQLVNKGIEFAVQHVGQLIQGQADAMVGDAVLGEIVGADLLAALPGAHLGPPRLGHLRGLLLTLLLVEPGP